MNGRYRDKLMQTDFYRNLTDEGEFMLKDSELKFWVQMTDPTYDNDDNPFIKFKLHHYDNVVSKTAPQDHREIPLVPCDNEYVDDVLKEIWYPG